MNTEFSKGLAVIVVMLQLLAAAVAHAEPLTIPRIFAAPDLQGPSLRSAQLSPDGRWLAYLRGSDANKDRLDLWGHELASGKQRLLVDAAALAPADAPLSAEEAARRERQRTASLSGILDYEFSPDAHQVLVPLAGDLFLYDLRAAPQQALRRLTNSAAYETDARFSPRGHFVSFVRDQNLIAVEVATGREIALTTACSALISCGMAEFIAQEEMDRNTGYWWSPDETRIAYTRVDESGVDEIERFEIDVDRARIVRQRYPAAGRPNARVQLFVADIAAPDEAVEMRIGAEQDQYLARVNWFPDSRRLAVQRQNRAQTRLELLRVDTGSGAASVLLTESSDAWVDLHDELTFVSKPAGFLWASARSGYRHLYLYGLDGRLIRPVTAGAWTVAGDGDRSIRGVDIGRGLVYFMANKDSPLERHLYTAPLNGDSDAEAIEAAVRRITREPGWHNVRMAKNLRQFVDTWSSSTTPPQTVLMRLDGRTQATIIANKLNESHPYAPFLDAHRPTEFGSIPASDGQTLYWQLLTPPNMAPGRRYPVVVDVYGGPGVQRVKNAWMGGSRANEGLFRQYLAQQGFLVFTLDNRGTSFRGTRFETALHRRMGQVEVEDQVLGVEFLRNMPFVDSKRIGIFGWSYGGYMALRSLQLAPDHFQVGVAGAPPTDWSLYDTHYTERYMGTPANNSSGYANSGTLGLAESLRGQLLLMHGMADDNVLFTNTTALAKRLQDLNKPFELMTYPGGKHGLMRGKDSGPHAYQTVFRFLERHLQSR